jgi:hypothetical protein
MKQLDGPDEQTSAAVHCCGDRFSVVSLTSSKVKAFTKMISQFNCNSIEKKKNPFTNQLTLRKEK